MRRDEIVGLDLSLTGTGIAVEGDETTLSPPFGPSEPWRRLAWIRDAVLAIVPRRGLVVIETPWQGKSPTTTAKLAGLAQVVRLALWERGTTFVDVTPSQMKIFAVNNGNAGKVEVVLAAAKRLGYDGTSDDEADARWLRTMALTHYAFIERPVPKSHLRAFNEVDWPTIKP